MDAYWGRKIRQRRTARGWSLQRLAHRTGLSAPYLSTVETGRAGTSSKSRALIAVALDATVPDLFTWPATVAETAALVGIDPSEAAA